jgi:para-aminobenzoate synthetase component 1
MSLKIPSLRAVRHSATPLVEELSPAPDAWEVARRLAHLPRLVFLDSAATDSPQGRYSFLTADPFDWLRTRGQDDNPFPRLAAWLARWRAEPIPDLPPFQGGAAGLFGYDLCHHLERLPRPRWDEFETPDLAIGFYDWVVAFDHHQARAWVISTGFPELDPFRRTQRAARRLRMVQTWVRGTPQTPPDLCGPPLNSSRLCPQYPVQDHGILTSNFSRSSYLSTVQRAIEYTHAGG